MRTSSLLALCLLVLGFSAARADGIYLSWNDCPLGATAASDLASGCDSNTGQGTLFCSFTRDVPTDSLLAIEITIDIQHSAPSLPPWWDLGSFPAPCRGGSLRGGADFSGLLDCDDPWQGIQVAGGVLSYTIGQPRGGSNQARIRAAFATTFDNARDLAAGHTYYAARFSLDYAKTVDGGSCAGCSGAACLVLNAVLLGRPPRPPGVPGGVVLLDTPGPGNPNWVTWQGGSGADCNSVPVKRVTWGRVKALYR
jgi:hypothetical protein